MAKRSSDHWEAGLEQLGPCKAQVNDRGDWGRRGWGCNDSIGARAKSSTAHRRVEITLSNAAQKLDAAAFLRWRRDRT